MEYRTKIIIVELVLTLFTILFISCSNSVNRIRDTDIINIHYESGVNKEYGN